MKNFFVALRWIPALVIFCVNWHLSSLESIQGMPVYSFYRLFINLPSDEIIESHLPGFMTVDKIVHCVCFAAFAFSVAFAIGLNPSAKFCLLMPVAIIALCGIVDEFHQSFTPGREFSFADWVADVVGAVIGSVVFFFLARLIFGKDKRKNPREEKLCEPFGGKGSDDVMGRGRRQIQTRA